MKYIRWCDTVLSRLLAWWCIFLMGSLTVGMILSVFLRYVFGVTFVWAEASITMVFLGTTYFGAALGVREHEHISIDYLGEHLPRVGQRLVTTLVMLVILAVEGMIVKTSLTWIAKVGSVKDVALNLPKSYFYLMVPVSAVLMMVYAVINIILAFSDDKGRRA